MIHCTDKVEVTAVRTVSLVSFSKNIVRAEHPGFRAERPDGTRLIWFFALFFHYSRWILDGLRSQVTRYMQWSVRHPVASVDCGELFVLEHFCGDQ